MPATSMFSLTVTGTPCSGPREGPASAASAAARASSASTSTTAFRWPLTASMRSRCASITSREDTSRLAISSASSPAPRRHSSSDNVAPLVDPSAPYRAGIARGAAGSRIGMNRLALALVLVAALAAPATASAAPEVRTAAGATPAALDPAVAAFRADVGAARREIDWDGAPATRLPGSFFAARGAQLDTPGLGGEVFDPAGPTWGAGMKPYSGKQLFTPVGSNRTDVRFNVPGTSREATTAAFGIVLSDVDTATGAALTFFDTRGKVIFEVAVPAGPNGLSFVSVRFTGGERVARVEVRAGAQALEPGEPEPPQADVAAIDDVIFGEPLADEPPPVEPGVLPERAARRIGAHDALAARVADPAGPQGPRGAHAEGRARHLGGRERDAHARQGEALARRAGGRDDASTSAFPPRPRRASRSSGCVWSTPPARRARSQ